jgi:DNA-binding HxlR family transcriptional regulator
MAQTAKKRSYGQDCALARGSDILGERWTLLLFRELLVRPCRFRDLAEGLEGIGSNLLAQRLRELETEGLVEKQDPGKPRSAYQLTAAGRSVEPVVLELIRWGYRHVPARPGDLHLHHWDLLAMKALFSADRCPGAITVQFDSPELVAWVRVSPDGFEHGLGQADDADLVLNTSIAAFEADVVAGVYRNDPVASRFVDCFDQRKMVPGLFMLGETDPPRSQNR